MADKIVVMNGGQVQQIGAPMDLYENPANRFVASFIGSPAMNLLPGKALGLGVHEVGMRPEHLRLVDAAGAPMSGPIKLIERLGSQTFVHVDVAGNLVCVLHVGSLGVTLGDTVGIAHDPAKLFRFSGSGARI